MVTFFCNSNQTHTLQQQRMQIHPLNLKFMLSPTLLTFSSLPRFHFKTKSFSSSSSAEFSPWSGLQAWRESPLNENRLWGPNGPEPPPPPSPPFSSFINDYGLGFASSLAELGALILSTSDPLTKSKLSHFAFSRWRNEKLPIGACAPPAKPARPSKPELVRSS